MSAPAAVLPLRTPELFAQVSNPNPVEDTFSTLPENAVPTAEEIDHQALLVLATLSRRKVRKALEHDANVVRNADHTVSLANDLLAIEWLSPDVEAEQRTALETTNAALTDSEIQRKQIEALRNKRYQLGEEGSRLRGAWPGAVMLGLGVAATASLFFPTKVTITTTESIPTTLSANVPHTGHASNPFSPDFGLTGTELPDDIKSLKAMLGTNNGSTIKFESVTIDAESSDDARSANAGLGHRDKGNHDLAVRRGQAADKALHEIANERGIPLADTTITVINNEHVLGQTDVSNIEAFTNQSLSVEQLVSGYESGKALPPGAKTVLYDDLGRYQAVTYHVQAIEKKSVTTQESTTGLYNLKPDTEKAIIIGSAMSVFAGFIYAGVGVLVNQERIIGKLANRRARALLNQPQ